MSLRSRTLLLSLALLACTHDTDELATADAAIADGGTRPASAVVDAALPAPTFEALFADVFEPSGCASYICHGALSAGVDFTDVDRGYHSLIDAPAQGSDCAASGLVRVVPGEPEQSLLYLKLFDPPPCGDPMPPSITRALSDAERQRVYDWILEGAAR